MLRIIAMGSQMLFTFSNGSQMLPIIAIGSQMLPIIAMGSQMLFTFSNGSQMLRIIAMGSQTLFTFSNGSQMLPIIAIVSQMLPILARGSQMLPIIEMGSEIPPPPPHHYATLPAPSLPLALLLCMYVLVMGTLDPITWGVCGRSNDGLKKGRPHHSETPCIWVPRNCFCFCIVCIFFTSIIWLAYLVHRMEK